MHVANGYLKYAPGLKSEHNILECHRCGNRDQKQFASYPCFRCKQECSYCRSCLMMGRVGRCSPLILSNHASIFWPRKDPILGWEGTLSSQQQKASTFLVGAVNDQVQQPSVRECLIWAVCGAGKTEMLFEGILTALRQNLRVLVATPRADVVRELEPRIKEAFPHTTVASFYGGVADRFAHGEITISTTHQLLRFYRNFDVVIIDEVDAFPFDHDPKLRYAVKQAAKSQHLTVFVTATPDSSMQSLAANGKLETVKVAKRFHGYPLPVPRFQWASGWRKKAKKAQVPSLVLDWLTTILSQKKQAFLFVPSIRLLELVLPTLKNHLDNVEGVYSEDKQRKEKVEQFRKGNIRLLLSTTILERGVTVKGVQVGVLGADDGVFTESALVQIAGRAGRSPEEPKGDVVYFHDGKTRAMVRAKRQIELMNELGNVR